MTICAQKPKCKIRDLKCLSNHMCPSDWVQNTWPWGPKCLSAKYVTSSAQVTVCAQVTECKIPDLKCLSDHICPKAKVQNTWPQVPKCLSANNRDLKFFSHLMCPSDWVQNTWPQVLTQVSQCKIRDLKCSITLLQNAWALAPNTPATDILWLQP